MFEEIKVQFLNKPKKLNHHNVISFDTLNQQLKKAYQLNNTVYSLWYEDKGDLMCIQNQYDFEMVEKQTKLKIIVLAEQQQAASNSIQHTKEPKIEIVKAQQQPNIKQIPKITVEVDEECQCKLLRTSGFTDIICLSCEKKRIKQVKQQKREKSVHKSQKKVQKAMIEPVLLRSQKKEQKPFLESAVVVARQPPFIPIQKPPKPIKIENKPQIKILIKPGEQEEFKQNQLKIKQYLDLLSTHQPIKQKKQGNQRFTNLTSIAKLVLNYQPIQQKPKIGGKQLTQKYQFMHQIFTNQTEAQLLQFIGNNMEIPIDQLPEKYQEYKHWY